MDCSIEVVEPDRDDTVIVEDDDDAPGEEAEQADAEDTTDHDIVYAGDETDETEMFATDATENGGETEENNTSEPKDATDVTEKDKSGDSKPDVTLSSERCKVSALFELKSLNDLLKLVPFVKSCTRLTISLTGEIGQDKLVRTSIYYETQHYKEDLKVLRELEAEGNLFENLRVRGEPIQPRTQVIVKNTPEDTTQEVLKMLFPTADRIILPDDKDSKNKGTAMLLFDKLDVAEKCVREETDIEIEGSVLTLEIKKEVTLPKFVDRRKSPPKHVDHRDRERERDREQRRSTPTTSSAVARGRELAKRKARDNERARDRSPHHRREVRRSPPHAGQIAYDISRVETKERQLNRMKERVMKNVISQVSQRFPNQSSSSTRYDTQPTRRQTTTDSYNNQATQNRFYSQQKQALLLDKQRQGYKQQYQQQDRSLNARDSYKSTQPRATPLLPERSMQSSYGRSGQSSHDRGMQSSHDRGTQSSHARSLSSSHNRNTQSSHVRSLSSSYDRNSQSSHDRRDLMSMNLKGMYQANASGRAEYLKQVQQQRLNYSY